MISSRASRQAPFRIAALAIVGSLLAAACGSATEPSFAPISVVADESQASPLPGDSGVAPDDPNYDPLDLDPVGDGASVSTLTGIPAGLETGFTADGHPYRGSADAPVTIVEYSDYACPFCGRHTSSTALDLLADYGVSGDVRFIFREFPLVSLHPNAPPAHVAAYCAGEQGAPLYWDMHDTIFAGQAEWADLADPTAVMHSMAESLGADMNAFEECVASGRGEAAVTDGVAAAQALGFNGTPSFELYGDTVDGTFAIIGAQSVEVFRSYVDSLLAGQAPTAPGTGEGPSNSLPYWADVNTGLRPDPDRPGVNLAGDFYKGNPDADLVVIEFSDFQCPFCRNHALEVQPTIDAELIETGQVLWVFKHLPLDIHPLAPAAGVAAECAGDQGQFFEMHHLIFEAVDRWTSGDVNVEMAALAEELGLDTVAFEACYNSADALERVLADLADAAGIISSTPTFVYIIGDQGALQEGSMALNDFMGSLRWRLEQAAELAG